MFQASKLSYKNGCRKFSKRDFPDDFEWSFLKFPFEFTFKNVYVTILRGLTWALLTLELSSTKPSLQFCQAEPSVLLRTFSSAHLDFRSARPGLLHISSDYLDFSEAHHGPQFYEVVLQFCLPDNSILIIPDFSSDKLQVSSAHPGLQFC